MLIEKANTAAIPVVGGAWSENEDVWQALSGLGWAGLGCV